MRRGLNYCIDLGPAWPGIDTSILSSETGCVLLWPLLLREWAAHHPNQALSTPHTWRVRICLLAKAQGGGRREFCVLSSASFLACGGWVLY